MGCISGTGRRWLSKKLDLCSFCAFLFALFHKNVVSLWTFMLSYRRLYIVVCLALVLVSVVACSNNETEMRRQLSELQACNQADSLMTNDSLAIALCEYFDHHGTANEQMMAHYLLGRTYADLGEAPQALDEFHHAADCADTTSADCDYRLLMKVHGQSASLFLDQYMPNEMLEELQLEGRYARKANDTITSILAIEWQHFAYGLLNQHQDAIAVLDSAYHQYLQSGYDVYAANSVLALIGHLVTINDNASAKQYIDIFESSSSRFSDGQVEPGGEIYYYYKGSYYLNIGMPDSAEYFFRKELEQAKTLDHQESAYKGLYTLYNYRGERDSIAKYAALCYATSEKQLEVSSSEELRHMQALYNYSRYQKISQEKTLEVTRSHHRLVVVIILFVFVGILIIIFIIVQRHRKKIEIERMETDYQYQINMLEQAKYDLAQLKQQEFNLLLQQKQQEIEDRQSEIEKTQQLISPQIALEPQMTQTEIYQRLQYLVNHPSEKIKKGEWKSLDKMVNDNLPNFMPKISSLYHLSEDDYHICVLIRLNFTLSEIGLLADKNPQELYKRRKFMMKKMFKLDEKPEKFDNLIKSII